MLWPPGAKSGRFAALASLAFAAVDSVANAAHRRLDVREILLRRQLLERDLRRQLDVDADAIRPPARLLDQRRRSFRDGLQMDVATEPMLGAQRPRDGNHLLHGVVRIADDARAEEQSFDVISPVKIEREADDFLRREACPLHVAGRAVDAVQAIVDAVVGKQDLEQRDATAVGRVAVADPAASGGSEPAGRARIALCRSAAGAGGVVLRGVR